MFGSSKMFSVILVIMAFATAAYAFASSGTVAAGNDGVAGKSVSEYNVTNITLTYSPLDHSIITYVDFDISPAVSQVSVSLVSGGALTDCGALTADGTHAHCPVNVAVASTDMLRVATSD